MKKKKKFMVAITIESSSSQSFGAATILIMFEEDDAQKSQIMNYILENYFSQRLVNSHFIGKFSTIISWNLRLENIHFGVAFEENYVSSSENLGSQKISCLSSLTLPFPENVTHVLVGIKG